MVIYVIKRIIKGAHLFLKTVEIFNIIGKFLKSGKDVAYIAEFLELPLAEVEKYAAEFDAL